MESKHNNPNCDECVRRDTSNSWSDLPSDLLISVFQCLGFADLQRAKSVCSSWHSVSKQSVPKNQIPWLILFPENSNYCRLFNPEEKDRLYQTKDLGFEFAKCDCIATYGNWLLMRDPGSYFYIVNLFTQERINLPPVESQIGMTKIERTLDNHFRISNDLLITPMYWRCMFTSSPVFWIDDTTKDYIVLWGLAGCCVVYSKKGDNFWNQIPESATYFDIVYKDHKLYITGYRNIFRIIDFSGEIPQETFQCYLYVHRLDKRYRFYDTKIVVTVSGDVLKVRKAWRSGFRIFKIYDSSSGLLKKSEKVESLGNEVIILDLGITVLANQLEEFNTNAIYFNGNYIKNPNTMFHFKLDTKKFERLDKFECSPVQFSSAHCFLPSFKQT